MKNNIDLTQDRDFPEDSLSVNPIYLSIHKSLFSIPWKLQPVKVEDLFYIDRLFPIGTKREIMQQYKENHRYTDGSCVCEKCGSKFKEIPWKPTYGLCEKCNESIKLHQLRMPWKTDSNIIKSVEL